MAIAAAAPLLPKVSFASGIQFIEKDKNPHKILTCNIRVALAEDDKAGVGWNARRKICADIMRKQNPDIIAMQEVLRNQNEDLKKELPNYFSFGFEGPEMDEFTDNDYHFIAKNPIFFSTKRYELVSAGGYWLSETPLVAGSKSWDTARARNANWVRLKDKKTNKQFRVVNVHLDHVNETARQNQIKVVLNDAAQYQQDFHQILTGDFNCGMATPVHALIHEKGWQDSYAAIHGNEEAGFTTHAFKPENEKGKGRRIDFIYTKGNFRINDAAIIKDNVNGHYPSDHYFVSADLNME